MSGSRPSYSLKDEIKRVRGALNNAAMIDDAENGRLSKEQLALKYGFTEAKVDEQLKNAMIDPAALPPDNSEFLRAAVRRGLQESGTDTQQENEAQLLEAVSKKQIEIYMEYKGGAARLRRIVLDQIAEMERTQELAAIVATNDDALEAIPPKLRRAVFAAVNFASRTDILQTLIANLNKLSQVDQELITLEGGPTADSETGRRLNNDQIDRLERLYEKFSAQGSAIKRAINAAAEKEVIDVTPTEVRSEPRKATSNAEQ